MHFPVWGAGRSLSGSFWRQCPFSVLLFNLLWQWHAGKGLTTGFQGIKPECAAFASFRGADASLVLGAVESSGLSRLEVLLPNIPLCSYIHSCLWGLFVWLQMRWYLLHFSSITCYFCLRSLAISLGHLLCSRGTAMPWRDYLDLFHHYPRTGPKNIQGASSSSVSTFSASS